MLAKNKSNTMKVSISKTLIDSDSSHDELVSMNKLLRKYNDMKEAVKNPKNLVLKENRKQKPSGDKEK